jgi:hypothetical protein
MRREAMQPRRSAVLGAALLTGALVIGACGSADPATPAPTSSAVATRTAAAAGTSPTEVGSAAPETTAAEPHVVCERLDPGPCREVVDAGVTRFPEVARSSLIVVDLGKDPKALDPGPDRYLISFVPTDATDLWMWPPTLQVVRGPTGLIVEPWDATRALPDFFVQELRAAGIDE